jgi:hypothetical protein
MQARGKGNMRTWMLAVALVGGCTLAGCGSGKGAAETSGAPSAAAAPASGNATALQVAAEARGKVRCPAKTRSPSRPANAPVDDVVGVRPGISYDEAVQLVLCSHELLVVTESRRGFDIQTYGQKLRQGFEAKFARERVQKSSQDIMREMQDAAMARSTNRVVRETKAGESRWYVATMGLPAEEKVISVAREEWFEAGRQPTIASVEQALTAKYGPPMRKRPAMPGAPRHELHWAHDLRQRPITESSPLFQRCSAVASPDAGNHFSPDCGIVVAAAIYPLRDNPDLAEYLQVAVVDQAGGYQAITETERALGQLDAQRRRQEVEQASKNASAPTL